MPRSPANLRSSSSSDTRRSSRFVRGTAALTRRLPLRSAPVTGRVPEGASVSDVTSRRRKHGTNQSWLCQIERNALPARPGLRCDQIALALRAARSQAGPRPGSRPKGAERRRVGQVEVGDLLDRHAVVDRGGGDVDAFGDLGAEVAEELQTEQSAVAVGGVAHLDRVAAGVVGLVVVGLGGDGERVEVSAGLRGRAGRCGRSRGRRPSRPGCRGCRRTRARRPRAFSAAMRPCLWAVVPSGR